MSTATSTSTPANPLWGGRFSEGASSLLTEINSSIHFDHRLAEHDVAGSIAHVTMLGAQGIVSEQDAATIRAGLETIRGEIERGELVFDPDLEDVHMNVEARLRELVGDVAGRLHTARSRNDQVAVDSKLWVRDAVDRLDALLTRLVEVTVQRAETHAADPMPGFTHLQCAQPVTIGHHLLAYGEMFYRDRDRFLEVRRRLNESPLGAAALAGTSHPIDPEQTARALGFDGVARNSLDAVSDRDFMLDFMAAGSTLAVHMSRLSEELVIWSTPQFGYVALPENLTAGSSIMPQKRNPDAAELVRAKTGRVVGDLVALLMVMKALPLAYSRDMQEDKESLFDAADTIDVSVRTVLAMLEGSTFFPERTRVDAVRGNTLATDVADWLVTGRNVPFRTAHGIVGNVVKILDQQGRELADVSVDELAELAPQLAGLPPEVLTVEHAVSRRTSLGGAAPVRVRAAAAELGTLNRSLRARMLARATDIQP